MDDNIYIIVYIMVWLDGIIELFRILNIKI